MAKAGDCRARSQVILEIDTIAGESV